MFLDDPWHNTFLSFSKDFLPKPPGTYDLKKTQSILTWAGMKCPAGHVLNPTKAAYLVSKVRMSRTLIPKKWPVYEEDMSHLMQYVYVCIYTLKESDLIWSDLIWYDMIWYGIWYDMMSMIMPGICQVGLVVRATIHHHKQHSIR